MPAGVPILRPSVGAPHIRQRLWWVAHATGPRTGQDERRVRQERWNGGKNGGLADAARGGTRRNGQSGESNENDGNRREIRMDDATRERFNNAAEGCAEDFPARVCATSGSGTSVWTRREFIPCADGKARVTQPGICPLAHGIPNRVGRLRAYGNAIVPQVAAEFVQA